MSNKIDALLYKNLEKAIQKVLEKELPDCHNITFTYSDWYQSEEEDEDENDAFPSTRSTNISSYAKSLLLLTFLYILLMMTLYG